MYIVNIDMLSQRIISRLSIDVIKIWELKSDQCVSAPWSGIFGPYFVSLKFWNPKWMRVISCMQGTVSSMAMLQSSSIIKNNNNQ